MKLPLRSMTSALDRCPGSVAPARGSQRDLRYMVADGAAFSVMVGLGEAYLPVFALAAGYGPAVAGWLATLPLVAGGLLQLITPYAVARLGSYRRWVVACALLQAASLLPLAVAAHRGQAPLGLLFACATLYWGMGLAAGPAWNSWAEQLVPQTLRASFFAHRARWSQGALLLGVLVGGGLLEWAQPSAQSLGIFGLLFLAAATARAISAGYLSQHSEPSTSVQLHRARAPWTAWRSLRGSNAERLLLYLVATQVAVNVASPFFTPYMLETLALSYGEYTALTAIAFLARMALLPLLGRVAHAHGSRFVLWLGAAGVAPLPALWLLSDAWIYLLLLQVVAGAAWACLELSTVLSFFEEIDPRDRTSVLSAFNLVSSVALAVGSLGGGWLLREIGAQPTTYAVLFVVSTLGRLAGLLLLRRTQVRDVPLDASALRTVAVRPSLGALQRPILAALPQDDPPSSRGKSGS